MLNRVFPSPRLQIHAHYELKKMSRHRRNLAITGGVALSIITAPVIAAVSVGKKPDKTLVYYAPWIPEADGQNKPGTVCLSASRHGAAQHLEQWKSFDPALKMKFWGWIYDLTGRIMLKKQAIYDTYQWRVIDGQNLSLALKCTVSFLTPSCSCLIPFSHFLAFFCYYSMKCIANICYTLQLSLSDNSTNLQKQTFHKNGKLQNNTINQHLLHTDYLFFHYQNFLCVFSKVQKNMNYSLKFHI